MKTVIYYATPNPDEIRRIRREYGLPDGMNVNRMQPSGRNAGTPEGRNTARHGAGTPQARYKAANTRCTTKQVHQPASPAKHRRKRKETQTPYPGKAQACRRKANQHV